MRVSTALLLVGLWPARAWAPGFDVSLEVAQAPPADPVPVPPGLAFTGAPLWILIALAALLMAAGLLTNEAAARRAAATT